MAGAEKWGREPQPLIASAVMCQLPQALQFLVVAVAGWINQQQRDVIDYLQEENRVLREHLAPDRLRFTDAQRRRLATKTKALGCRALGELETLRPWRNPRRGLGVCPGL